MQSGWDIRSPQCGRNEDMTMLDFASKSTMVASTTSMEVMICNSRV
jgi:hypothetical protein